MIQGLPAPESISRKPDMDSTPSPLQASTMDVMRITGPLASQVCPEPVPIAGPDWVVIKVETTPICTEYKSFEAGGTSFDLGHEAAGEIVEVGRKGRWKVGDRVLALPLMACGACELCQMGEYIHCLDRLSYAGFQGTYAQYHAKPEWGCFPVPEDISTESASLAVCGLGPSFGALQRLDVTRFDTVLITGLGPVGLGGIINAKHRGARVLAVDSHPYRKGLAAKLGADFVLDPTDDDIRDQIQELTSGRGVPKAVDCSGNPAAHRLCIDAAATLGKIAFVGECTQPTTIRISPDLIRRGITLIGSWNYNLQDVPLLMQVIRQERSRIQDFVTHRFPLRQAQQAWELQRTGNCGKILLQPWEVEA